MTDSRPAPQDDSPVPGAPQGEVYDWFRRGTQLLEGGSPAAATELLSRAHAQEPESASITEALARAYYDSGRYSEAVQLFAALTERNPGDDYALFGHGLALSRTREFALAAEKLALAVAMRPDRPEYSEALRQVRATLKARAQRDAAGAEAANESGAEAGDESGGEAANE